MYFLQRFKYDKFYTDTLKGNSWNRLTTMWNGMKHEDLGGMTVIGCLWLKVQSRMLLNERIRGPLDTYTYEVIEDLRPCSGLSGTLVGCEHFILNLNHLASPSHSILSGSSSYWTDLLLETTGGSSSSSEVPRQRRLCRVMAPSLSTSTSSFLKKPFDNHGVIWKNIYVTQDWTEFEI